MVVAIVVLIVLAVAAAVSIALVVRDVRRLHRQRRELADGRMGAGSVSLSSNSSQFHIPWAITSTPDCTAKRHAQRLVACKGTGSPH